MNQRLSIFFNDYYINIVEISSGVVPTSIENQSKAGTKRDEIIDKIINKYKAHKSIIQINNMVHVANPFSFKETTEAEVFSLLKSVDSKKSVGVDQIPPRIIRDYAEVLTKPITELINQSIKENVFPSKAKIAAVLPFFKKEDRLLKKNYRPISVLSAISKIF